MDEHSKQVFGARWLLSGVLATLTMDWARR